MHDLATEADPGPPAGPAPVVGHPAPHSLLADRDPRLARNKRLVFDMWRSIVNAGHVELAADMLAESYIQHSPVISTGRDAFVRVFSTVPRADVPNTVTPPLVAILAEGDLVVMALRDQFPAGPGGGTYSTTHFNLFRVAKGRLAEHWHSVATPPGPAVPPPEAGGPQAVTGLAGAAQARLLDAADPDLTANKRLAYDALRTMFEPGRADAVSRFVGAAYVEHDPNFASGVAGLRQRLAAQADAPVADYLQAPLVAIVAAGDLVVVVRAREHPHPSRQGAIFTTTEFDMFRVERGRLAEHWTGATLAGAPAPRYGE